MPVKWYHTNSVWSGFGDIRRQALRFGYIEVYDLVLSNYDNFDSGFQGKESNDDAKREYQRRRYQMKRFWNKVQIADDSSCWPWTATKIRKGYGRFNLKGENLLAHRVAWELSKGKIPSGLHVLHRCDNPSCCNPTHLFLGTNNDNVKDKINKGRLRQGVDLPYSKLTAEEIIAIRNSDKTQRWLAEHYNVGAATICNIKNRRTYKNV